jgi:hypothetical protein
VWKSLACADKTTSPKPALKNVTDYILPRQPKIRPKAKYLRHFCAKNPEGPHQKRAFALIYCG